MNKPIGIFDSGLGGLTVFRALQELLPQEELIYLGDTARVPYGTKSAPTVTQYSRENSAFLHGHQVKVIVVACNTASAYAVPQLKEEFQVPIIGVLEPGAAHAATETRNQKIGVIGTAGTIASEAYPRALQQINPELQVFSQACPLFVPLVEEGWLDRAETTSIARTYLGPLLDSGIDTLILGCTHYPLLKSVLQTVVGPDVRLIDSAIATAEDVKGMLGKSGALCPPKQDGTAPESAATTHQFFVTDAPERFQRVGEIFLGHALETVVKV
jgi:glutamate racemase